MTQADEIEHYRNQFMDYTKDQLVTIMLQYPSHMPYHIAAKLLIDQMDKQERNRIDDQLLTISKGANKWAKYACIIGLLSLLAFVVDFVYRSVFVPSKKPDTTSIMQSTTQQKSSAKGISDASTEKQKLDPSQIRQIAK